MHKQALGETWEAGFQVVLQTRGFVQPEHQKEDTGLTD